MPTPPFRNQPSARDHYGIKWPKAVAKVTDDFDVLLAFYDYSAEHSIHLAPPIESTFATVRLRPRVAKARVSARRVSRWRSSSSNQAQTRCWAVNAPHLVALVRAGVVFKNGELIERAPDESEAGDQQVA